MPTITLQEVEKSFAEPDGSVRRLFGGLDMHIAREDKSVAILGRSGSGKSSLLRILAGLDIRYGGSYLVDGHALRRNEVTMSTFRREHVGVVTQRYDLLAERTALQNIMLGLGAVRTAYREPAHRALARVGLDERGNCRAGRLSGGEAQRVAIARAIVKRPAIILADEPTGALDERTEDDILDLFDDLQEAGSTMIIATHSARVAERCARRFVLGDHGISEL